MNIREIVRAGMICAVYGMLVAFNTFSGLWLETAFPIVFALPMMVVALENEKRMQVSGCAFAAMLLLTLMLSSLTIWLIAGAMLVSGLVVGSGLARHWNVFLVFFGSFAILFALSMVQMTILSALFGFDLTSEIEGFERLLSFITPMGLIVVLALFEAFLEALGCVLFGIVLMGRLMPDRFFVETGADFTTPPICAWIFFILFGLWVWMLQDGKESLAGWRDVCMGATLIDYELIVWQGYLVLIKTIARKAAAKKLTEPKKEKRAVFLVTLSALLPITNAAVFAAGLYDRIKASFSKRKAA